MGPVFIESQDQNYWFDDRNFIHNFIALLFIVSIIKVIYMRLRVVWVVICLYLAVKSRCPFSKKRGSKMKKVHELHFRIELDLHSCFQATLAVLKDFKIFVNFDHIFTITLSLFRPVKVARRRWAKNLDCKYKYLTNGKQLN